LLDCHPGAFLRWQGAIVPRPPIRAGRPRYGDRQHDGQTASHTEKGAAMMTRSCICLAQLRRLLDEIDALAADQLSIDLASFSCASARSDLRLRRRSSTSSCSNARQSASGRTWRSGDFQVRLPAIGGIDAGVSRRTDSP